MISSSSFHRQRFLPQFVSTFQEDVALEKPEILDFYSRSGELSLQDKEDDEYQRGLVTIGFITLLFASNSPALHAAFTSFESPPPVLLVNAVVSILALLGLVSGGSALESNTPLPSNLEMKSNDNPIDTSLQGGLELGMWKFLGTTTNLAGLSLTTASHGALLIQLTTLIVPVVQGIMGVPISRRLQCSVGLALAGVLLFCQGNVEGSTALASSSSLGDALCVLAAGFYATYDLRLFEWGKQVPARELITTKIGTQAILSVALLLAFGFSETQTYFQNMMMERSSMSFILPLLLLWSGVAVNAIAPFLQVGGQQAIGPTKCQTIYASQPLWAGIMSYMCLGETFGTQALVGGGAFLVALYLAATAENSNIPKGSV